jgi:hypothetical protein
MQCALPQIKRPGRRSIAAFLLETRLPLWLCIPPQEDPDMPEVDEARKIIVGETAPDFSLPDTTGTSRRLSELTADSLCVVLFYRGHW